MSRATKFSREKFREGRDAHICEHLGSFAIRAFAPDKEQKIGARHLRRQKTVSLRHAEQFGRDLSCHWRCEKYHRYDNSIRNNKSPSPLKKEVLRDADIHCGDNKRH